MALLFALVAAAPGGQALAQDQSDHPTTPVMLSVITPLQAPARHWDVTGLRLSLVYGECHRFRGLDVGGVGRATGGSLGVQLHLLANVVDGEAIGLQAAGAHNHVRGAFRGLQAGLSNYAEETHSLQAGAVNVARDCRGLQVGLINVTTTMLGVQIGLVNIIRDNDVPFLPLINGYF